MVLENVNLSFLFLGFSSFNMASVKDFTKQLLFSNAKNQTSFKVLLQKIAMPTDNIVE